MKVAVCLGCNSAQYNYMGKSEAITDIRNDQEFVQEEYSILKCKNCGLYYKDHILSEEQLNQYYNSFDFSLWTPSFPYPTETIAANFLIKASGKSSRVLDYGCSDGRFLSQFADNFRCYGYDIDERAILLAREKGITILDKYELSLSKDSFDFIVLSDVFEHSSQPTILIEELFLLMKKGGSLIIITGNADAKLAKFDLADYWYFKNLQHLCMLGDEYINFLVKKLNCQLTLKETCSHYDDNLVKKRVRKLFFELRFFLYRNISVKKKSFKNKFLKRIPVLKKITKWYTQPFYPYSKDHLVIVLKKNG
jgi:SAM-dependent methyltransferase